MAVATNTLKPQLLKLKKGEYVFEEGDEAIFAYVLTEGVIEIVATSKGVEQVLAKIEKGTVFGEMAVIDGFQEVHLHVLQVIVRCKKLVIKNFFIILQKNQIQRSL